MTRIKTREQLQTLYGTPRPAALEKVSDHVTAEYRKFIEAAPFAALATVAPDGIDCSPRGDKPGFVRVSDDGRTLMLPDRQGNNRVDSLANIIGDPRVSLMFMVPGNGNIIRVNGKAHLSIDAALLESFSVNDKAPRSVTVIAVNEIYFQCARAIVRSDLWNSDTYVDAKSLPTPGKILTSLSAGRIDGDTYDREWPERAKKTLW